MSIGCSTPARVRLWLAEERGGFDELDVAASTFDGLRAHPYLSRAHRLGI